MDDLEPVIEAVSRYFALLSEPMRIRILQSICNGEKSVTEIVTDTGATQTNVSRHLNTLYSAGVLRRRKQGNFIFYAIGDDTLTEICRMVCVHVAGRPGGEEVGGQALARSFRDAEIVTADGRSAL